MKKRITPTLVGKEDDASIRLTARQIAAEEAKANKAQAEFQAKRRTEANLKKKQLKRKKQQLKRKREEDESPPPPPPQEITVVRKTTIIRGKTKRQASVAANREKPIVETVDCDSDDSARYKTPNMIKKFLLDQEKEEARAVATNKENGTSLHDAAQTLSGMKATVDAPNFGDNPDDEMSTSKSSQSAVDENSLASESTVSGGNNGEDEESAYEEGGDEDSSIDLADDMVDVAVNEDEDYPMADPELVLLDMSKKESALDKAIRAAELVAKDEVRLDDDVKDEGCIWCGDVGEQERKVYVTESMNERNLIFDDIDSLKRHATFFLHPEQPLYVDPLSFSRSYFDRASAPQPVIHVPQPVSDAAPADEDATAFKGSDSASVKESKGQSAKGSDSASVKEAKGQGQSTSSPEKTGRGNRKRPAGHRPETALQQGDANVRLKLDGVQLPIERLQTMTLPVTRSDETTAELEAENAHQKDWPWVIHGAFCYTEQQPNEDGQKSAPGKLGTPELHFWAGSEQSKHHLYEMLKVTSHVKVHGDFESYKRAFRSSSGMAKPAPPVKKKIP